MNGESNRFHEFHYVKKNENDQDQQFNLKFTIHFQLKLETKT